MANELLWTASVPLLVAAVVMAAATWLLVRPRAAWALGVGLGFVIACLALASRTVGLSASLAKYARPHEAHDWLPLAVLSAMGVTLLAAAAPREWQRWIVGLAGLLCVAIPMRLLAGNVAAQWSAGQKLSHLALLAAALALVWLLLSTARDDESPRLRAMLLVIVAAAMAVTLAKSGSLVFGQRCGVVAAAIAGATLASYGVGTLFRLDAFTGGRSLPSKKSPDPFDGLSGAAGVLTMSLGGLLVVAHFYAALTATSAALLATSLLAAGGRLPARLASGPAWRQAALRTALCLTPLAIAVASAL